MAIIDISVPVEEGKMPIYPRESGAFDALYTNPSTQATTSASPKSSSACTPARTWTRPCTTFHDAGGIETVNLETLMGPARVIAVENHECITAEELATKNLEGATRFLIKTRNSDEGWWTKPYSPDYCHMTPEAGQLLYDHGMELLGVDYLGVDAPDPNAPVHMLLMPLGVVLLEGLNLSECARGRLRAHRPARPVPGA